MFVVFEGIDGSGKTTLSNRVRQQLEAEGVPLKHLRESGKFASRVTESIRSLGRDSRNLELAPEAEFLLYVARDVQLIEESLKPILDEVDLVIADRFLYTALNLGKYGRGLPDSFTAPILAVAGRSIEPDLVILVDVDPTLARARRQSQKLMSPSVKPPSRKGLAGTGLQRQLRAGYFKLAAADPKRWLVVDNSGDLAQTVEQIATLIRNSLKDGAPIAMKEYRDARQREVTPPSPAVLADTPKRPGPRFFRWIDARAELEPSVAAWMLGGLAGPGADERRLRLAEDAPPVALDASKGLTDPLSWQLRERYLDKYPVNVLLSMGSLPEEALAVPWFESLALRFPAAALKVLTGSTSEFAWQLRHKVYPEHTAGVVASVAGLGDAQAWAWRDAWFRGAPPEESAERFAWANSLARGLRSVPGERADQLRKKLFPDAPVAVLESLLGLDDAASWHWRTRYLARAPKVVMGTLAGLEVPAAFDLRLRVVEQCREALEGLRHSRSEDAYQLRYKAADLWPSTVIKSLGCAAHTPRGRELFDQLLGKYPDNVSLLKHATAIDDGLVSCRCAAAPS